MADAEMEMTKEKEDPGKKVPYPKRIFLIVAMEACERFSYYGMNAILTIYLINLLKRTWPNNEDHASDVASIIYHLFKFGCYATGLLGAVLADSFVGKYRTIFYIGLIYVVGQATLALGAVGQGEGGIPNFPNQVVSFIGIFLIAIGTGGIKPCVVSLGADQFKLPEQKEQMTSYFAMFYASINLGSLIATIIVPLLRRVECMGEDSCFTLAFGLPAVLICIALVFFWFGRNHYTGETPEKNIIVEFFKISWYAVRSRGTRSPANHWLDRASDRYDQTTIDEMKAVYRVGYLFMFYPMYWALYDQQGSRWTIQAMKMNGYTFGFLILPDQMQVANPILILLLIPLFDRIIYPLLGKVNMLTTPLHRIVTGCFLCGLSFVISGGLEVILRQGYPDLPRVGQTKIVLHNSLDCDLNILFEKSGIIEPTLTIQPSLTTSFLMDQDQYNVKYACSDQWTADNLKNFNLAIGTNEESVSLFVRPSGDMWRCIHEDEIEQDTEDPMPTVRLIVDIACSSEISAVMTKDKEIVNIDIENSDPTDSLAVKLKKTGSYQLTITCGEQTVKEEDLDFKLGGNYNVYLTDEKTAIYTVVEANSVHMFWLLPQYIVITVGEIMFSITSLEFAYSQAPPSMKSVLQALFLMTTAVGNLITMLIVEIFSALKLEQFIEFFTFAALMTVFSFILMFVSTRYEYVYYTEGPAKETAEDSTLE